MGDHNIELNFIKSQEEISSDQIVCILCDGTHGNNSLCMADLNTAWS
jgi:hypothetical protein